MDFLLGIHFLRRNISLPRLPPATVSTIDLDGDVGYFFASVSYADGTNNRAAVNERNWKREEREGGHRTKSEKRKGSVTDLRLSDDSSSRNW